MNRRPAGLKAFLLSDEKEDEFKSEFPNVVITSCDLERNHDVAKALADYKDAPGIYFWTFRLDGSRYKIYLGKTKSFLRRTKEYMSPFQPGSPNDYKLRAFHSYAKVYLPGAHLDLHFHPLNFAEIPLDKARREELTKEENCWLDKFRPFIINKSKRERASEDETKKAKAKALEESFLTHYHSIFKRKLGE